MTAVLIVEDEAAFGTALRRELEQDGFDAHVCQNVAQGLELLKHHAFDVVLTDLRVGEPDGMALIEEARRISARTRCILMSGYASARDYQRAVELGAVAVLCKPFSHLELSQAIRQALECETGFRGSLHGLSLLDVLQMLHFARRPVELSVGSVTPGKIYLRDGEIVHAECGGRVGEEALRAILSMPAGTLSTGALPDDVPATVARVFEVVLLDAVRALDEEAAGTLSSLPAASTLPVRPHKPQPRMSTDPFAVRAQGSNGHATVAPSTWEEPPTEPASSSVAARHFDRGLELVRAREHRGALAEWRRAVELAPDNRTYQANLRRLQRLLGDNERA